MFGMPMLDREEQLIILFALLHCGGKGSHDRIIDFILENHLMQPRPGDDEIRSNGAKAIVNDLERARQDLKECGSLSMPQHGVWAITAVGRARITKLVSDVSTNRGRFDKALADGEFVRIGKAFLDASENFAKGIRL
jgi:hypothetical protein